MCVCNRIQTDNNSLNENCRSKNKRDRTKETQKTWKVAIMSIIQKIKRIAKYNSNHTCHFPFFFVIIFQLFLSFDNLFVTALIRFHVKCADKHESL